MGKQTVVDTVFDKIQRAILSGQYQPGARLNIETLKQEYGVSLTPVREALNRLISMEYVVVEANKGFRVATVSLTELEDLYAGWVFVYKHVLELSMEHGDDEWESEVLSATHRLCKFEQSEDFQQQRDIFTWRELYRNFHCAVINGCPSAVLVKVDLSLFDQLDRYRYLIFSLSPNLISLATGKSDLHQRLARAIIERDKLQAFSILDESLAVMLSAFKQSLLANTAG